MISRTCSGILRRYRNTIGLFSYYLFLLRKNLLFTTSIHSYLTNKEKIKLYSLARQRSGVFVEIGSYLGCSACFIATGMLANDSNSKLYCIDTWDNRATSEPRRSTKNDFLLNTVRFERNLIPIHKTSVQAAKEFDRKIDFLFIDADHSYQAIKTDVESWFPKLNPNALVIFHDVQWHTGVKRVLTDQVVPLAKSSGQLPNLWWGIV